VFPALPKISAEDPPAKIPCRRYPTIAKVLPALVRRTAQGVWYDTRDPSIAANDVFDEEDGLHSFYEVGSVEDLVAVGAYLSRGGEKPFKRATYFCILPNEVRDDFEVSAAPTDDSQCEPLNTLHRHVYVGAEQKESLFRIIQQGDHFNYRVDKTAMLAMSAALRNHNCRDYSPGPCALCSQS
jgi:hypothetical protein